MIFQFENYRIYLKKYMHNLPKRGFGEAKRMADHLGVSSTFISHVLNATKTFSTDQALTVSRYLGHTEIEADYFFYLVQLERAGTKELKKFCEQKLEKIREQSEKLVNRVTAKKILTEQEKSIFYSNPIYSAIHIYCATNKKGKTAEEVSTRFEISRSKATQILQFLVQANLCHEDGGYVSTGSQSTHLEHDSPYLLKHHTNWRLRAIQAAEELGDQELMYTLNVALAKKDFIKLREDMVQFISGFLESVYPSPSEEIACLNLDWFWIRK